MSSKEIKKARTQNSLKKEENGKKRSETKLLKLKEEEEEVKKKSTARISKATEERSGGNRKRDRGEQEKKQARNNTVILDNKKESVIKQAHKWLNNFGKVSEWAEQYAVSELLEEEGGLVEIEDFLPDFVAEAIMLTLHDIPDEEWQKTSAVRSAKENNIDHEFFSVKYPKEDLLQCLFRALLLLAPLNDDDDDEEDDSDDEDEEKEKEKKNLGRKRKIRGPLTTGFSAGRYGKTHHIDPHDDRAYADVHLESGEVIQCSRDIALIVYFNKEWSEEDGGLLYDCQGDQYILPRFNHAVFFRVPRFHQVTPVHSPHKLRYSVYGWYLKEGQLYDLESSAQSPAMVSTQNLEKEDNKKDKNPKLGGQSDSLAEQQRKEQELRYLMVDKPEEMRLETNGFLQKALLDHFASLIDSILN